MNRFSEAIFLTSGTWTCPAGVTKILVSAMGGGSGGNGGQNASSLSSGGSGGNGGNAVVLQTVILDVVPDTTYTITIGAGGTAGAASGGVGGAGGNTSFGALMTWYGASPNIFNGGTFFSSGFQYPVNSTMTYDSPQGGGSGFNGGYEANANGTGFAGYIGRAAAYGTYGASVTSSGAGGGSGMSGEDIGGTGGNGGVQSTTFPTAGGNAPANSGAGGGGGGGGRGDSVVGNRTGAAGGTGGSGKMIVRWVE